MELKKLELFGFKSFADRTRFEFDSGITCIVGPNGCGKSNVVDAVKWVLGEQSAKSLRGREMADVIFAGSESRRSLGFAEVALTFDNSRGLLPIDLAEVEVTRRLYRSGESEYLLNRRPCRLRDIRELFMDTGVGVDAYSLIEQGKVDVLLQSNPQERRLIFEEAAGISKYKAKRREAQRKLDRTGQNLLRLGDVLDEVERRLRSVKLQAGKARNFMAYTERLRELRLSHALNQYDTLSRAVAAHREAVARLQDERSARSAALAALEAERSRLEGELMDLDEAVRRADGRLGDVRGAIATRDNETGFHRTRLEELEEAVARDRAQIGRLQARLREAEAACEARRADLDDVAARAETHEGVVRRLEERLAAAVDAGRAAAADLDAAKTALMDLAREKSQAASRDASLQMRLEGLHAQADKLRARRDQVDAQLRETAVRETELRARHQELADALAARRGRLDAKRSEAEAVQAEVEALGRDLAAAKEKASALESRRQVLDDLERRGEGIPAAVRRATEAIQAAGRPDAWRGMVADLIDVDVDRAVLVEAALGPAEKLLIAERRADALALADELRGQLSGQVRMLALDALPAPAARPDLAAHPEALGWAADVVRADPAAAPAIAHLLGRTVIVRGIEDGLALRPRLPAGHRFVTPEGDLVEADGSLAVGPPGAETSLISRRSELRTLVEAAETVAAEIADLDARRTAEAEGLRGLDAEQQQLRQEIYEASMAKVEAEGALRRAGEARQALQEEAPVLEAEQAAVAEDRRRTDADRADVAGRIEALAAREAAEQERIDALVAEVERRAAERADLEEERTQARVELAQLREKHGALRDQVEAARRDRAAASDGIDQARRDLAQAQDRIRDSRRAMLRLQSELSALFLDKEAAEAEVRRVARDRADRREALAKRSGEAREVEAEVEALQEQVHARELEARGEETKRDELVQRVRDEFDMDLAEKHRDWHPEEVDWDAVAEEIRELTGKIERLGVVNVDAIREQEELEARVAFLHKQNDDLVAAREALDHLIERINRESRDRFTATFNAVREHFQDLFRKLFGGGKADVYLEDSEDVLETGIEVVARPPGKQLQRISLLSGGEKTMAAVALLLAVFRARPSPFCILDEVDAALDESNIDRFTGVVREFLAESQFVIISHNKRTMSIADVLYGVTMQEPGVSRKVSVRFADLHEQGLLDDAPPAEAVAEPVPAE